jgi:hypothetical protein
MDTERDVRHREDAPCGLATTAPGVPTRSFVTLAQHGLPADLSTLM